MPKITDAAILNWAVAHFGANCSPVVSRDDGGGLVLSVTDPGTHDCYRLPLRSLGYGLFRVQGITVEKV
jgi:hypothetical protein